MKIRRRSAPVPAPPPIEDPRARLRDFADFLDRQDPDALAAAVTDVDGTLVRCARIEAFFRRYTSALKMRVVH